MRKQSRNIKLVNIRALAIILVVLGHSIILYSKSWNLYTTTREVPILDTLKLIIDQFQMPLFVAVSGYLFFYGEKKRTLLELLAKKFQRLIIPYFCVSIFYLLPIRLLVRYPDYIGMSAIVFFKKVLTSTDVGHLWFLPALYVMFIVAKLFLLICAQFSKSSKLNSVLLFLFSCLLYFEGYKIGIQYPPLLNCYNYLIWFSFGFCLNAFSSTIEKVYERTSVKIILILVCFILLFLYMTGISKRVSTDLVLRAIFIADLFGIMLNQTNEAISRIDRNSFGLYLFHSPLIYIVFATIPNASPLLVVAVNFIMFGLIAYYLTELMRKLHLSFVIGE